MASTNRAQDTGLALYEQLALQPYTFDFYQALRRLEAQHCHMPRIGDAARPSEEPVRLCHEPSLTFAPANISSFEPRTESPPRLSSRFLGLFGPQGALPTYMTELARERLRSHDDPTLARFADVFHHRLLCAFYKAWRQAQPAASHDRPETDRFSDYLDALFGGIAQGDCLPGHAKRYFTGHLASGKRNGAGLESILSGFFGVPCALQSFYACWMPLPPDQRSQIGMGQHTGLGKGMVIGKRVWDAQHHFLLQIGPLTLQQYTYFLPGNQGMLKLRDWVSLYTDRQFGWRAKLLLKRKEVPQLKMGRFSRLGWTTWLGRPGAGETVEGHLLNGEREPVPSPLSSSPPWNASAATSHSLQEASCLK